MPKFTDPAFERGEAREHCSIAAAIVSAVGGAVTAGVASSAQGHAANKAANTQLSMYNQTRSDLMPYMQTGSNALSQLANIWGLGPGGNGTPNAAAATQALTQFPGYQFGLNQGVTALDRSAASRGLLLSGAQMQDAQTFGQQYAMQNAWQPYVTQLDALATMGQDSAAKVGTIGQQYGSNIGQAQIAAGNAQAAGILGVGNSLTGGIQNALLAYSLYGGGGGAGGTGGFLNGLQNGTGTVGVGLGG